MNGPNLMQFAMNMLKQNPNVARNPQAQAMLQVLQSGDAQKGQQIAQNLCQTYGITPEEAVKQARHHADGHCSDAGYQCNLSSAG